MAHDSGAPRRRERVWLWLWAVAAIASVAVLVAAIFGRETDPPGGATLRAMAASESMTDAEASAVAGNTARVWIRERNERHLANLEALSCPDTHDGALAYELNAVRSGDFIRPYDIVAVAGFSRNGPEWTVDAFWPTGGVMFALQVRDGELRVCQIQSAPVPGAH